MSKEELERELQSISILLREHGEWRYRYPGKFEAVRSSAVAQFKALMVRYTGVILPGWMKNIPVEEISPPFYSSALKIAGKMRRTLSRQGTRAGDHETRTLYEEGVRIWIELYSRLRKI